ncbi:hypothetical protein [Photobacterium leiognathi]|uniref:hypothetical protein n=1 Tax=Photobacterium leiognathi TaxID=553611 RepID=UPI002738C65F|nr:hypothetical protein [Photobacterium leiognathi]
MTKETISKREKKFKRVIFSLIEHEDQLLDELSFKVRSFRCNRSQVVKAALALLECIGRKNANCFVKKTKRKLIFACSLSMFVNSKSYPHIQ